MARKIINDVSMESLFQTPHVDLYVIKCVYDNDIQSIIDDTLTTWEQNNCLAELLIPLQENEHPTATHVLHIDGISLYMTLKSSAIFVVDVQKHTPTPMAA